MRKSDCGANSDPAALIYFNAVRHEAVHYALGVDCCIRYGQKREICELRGVYDYHGYAADRLFKRIARVYDRLKFAYYTFVAEPQPPFRAFGQIYAVELPKKRGAAKALAAPRKAAVNDTEPIAPFPPQSFSMMHCKQTTAPPATKDEK